MKTLFIMGVALMIGGMATTQAPQQPGSKRTQPQQHDLSTPGREVIQVCVDFDPG